MAGERNVGPKPTLRQYSLDHPMVERSLFRAVFNHRKRLNLNRLRFPNPRNFGRKMDAICGSGEFASDRNCRRCSRASNLAVLEWFIGVPETVAMTTWRPASGRHICHRVRSDVLFRRLQFAKRAEEQYVVKNFRPSSNQQRR